MRRPWIAAAIALSFSIASGLAGLPAAADGVSEQFDTVVVDAGHGGEDEGARGVRGLVEKELVLDVGRRLAALLRGRDLRVVMTRSDDRFVSLEERFSIANDARGDLFVSIHANATRDSTVRGVETFFLSLDASDDDAMRVARRENEAFGAPTQLPAASDPLSAILGDLIESDYLNESNEFARLVQLGLANGESNHSRGVKQAPFVVLQGVQMPSSLVEIGFVTNPSEERRLQSPQARAAVAAALADAVVEFGRRFDARRGVASRGARGEVAPLRTGAP